MLEPLPRESLKRLRQITQRRGLSSSAEEREEFAEWIRRTIAPRNIAGLANAERRNLYPVDFEVLVERHALLGMDHDQLLAALPALRGSSV